MALTAAVMQRERERDLYIHAAQQAQTGNIKYHQRNAERPPTYQGDQQKYMNIPHHDNFVDDNHDHDMMDTFSSICHQSFEMTTRAQNLPILQPTGGENVLQGRISKDENVFQTVTNRKNKGLEM